MNYWFEFIKDKSYNFVGFTSFAEGKCKKIANLFLQLYQKIDPNAKNYVEEIILHEMVYS